MHEISEKWKQTTEPPSITRINKDYAKKCSNIIPGASQKFLAMAVQGIKPISLKHLDISHEQIRDFWFNQSESTNKQFILNQWDNIIQALKRKVRFPGKRKFIALACGQVSMLHKWKNLDAQQCVRCGFT